MELFPALLIGGPPDSGKSVLTYHLTQALRERGVEHYVLRANPDGEGDWRAEADPVWTHTILIPRNWTPSFVEHVCQDLARRQLPMIVDIGGRPQPWQEAILDYCTHAILLTPNSDAHTRWLTLLQRHHLLLLADLRSELHGTDAITTPHPLLTGIITGLEWGQPISGPTFQALVERVARLFAYTPDELRRTHLTAAPVENAVDLDRLARTLGAPLTGQKVTWQPRHLPPLLDYLPQAVPLALYGRGPNWLYAAVARLTCPAEFYQFDPRLGWVTPPILHQGSPPPHAPLQTRILTRPDHTRMEFALFSAYLDYNDAQGLLVPPSPPGRGLVLSGKLPLWLWTALAIAYQDTPWLAVYQPPWGDQALVIHARVTRPRPGMLVPSSP